MSCKYVHCPLARNESCYRCQNYVAPVRIESHAEAAARIVCEELEAERQ